MAEAEAPDIERAIDELYQAPLGDFVERRNRLATELRKAGDNEGAQRVKSLTKPPLSTWVVNQLYWRARPVFDHLIAQGDKLRAQQVLLAGGDNRKLQEAAAARQDALEDAMRQIDKLANAEAVSLGAPLRQRAATTLEALAAFGSAREPAMNGRLTADIDPPGLAALASLVPADAPLKLVERKAPVAATKQEPAAPIASPGAERRLAKARDAVSRAQTELERAKAGAERATHAEEEARQRYDSLQEQVGDLQKQLAALERDLGRAEADWQRARLAQGRAHADAKSATAALEAARVAVGNLMDDE